MEQPMSDQSDLISPAFRAFRTETPDHAKAWGEAVQALSEASALDAKTWNLAYLSVLAAIGMDSGVPFHVKAAETVGATRDEILSAILVGLLAAGHVVTQSLPAAVAALGDE